MAIKVETIEVDVDINSGKATAGLKNLERQTKKTTSTMKGLGVTISAANIATRAITAAVKGTIQYLKSSATAAANAEETWSKFETVYKNVSKAAEDAADVLVDSFGQTSTAARAMLGDVGDILTGFGFTEEAAVDLASQVSELGVDLASFTNFSGGAEGAVQALTKAMLGEAESVKALGIVIRQDTPEYKNRIALIMETTGVSLTQAKAVAALQIATEQSKNAVGDYARTFDSAVNVMRRFENSQSDLAEAMGVSVLEGLTPFREALTKLNLELASTIRLQNEAAEFSKNYRDGTIDETSSLEDLTDALAGLEQRYRIQKALLGGGTKDLLDRLYLVRALIDVYDREMSAQEIINLEIAKAAAREVELRIEQQLREEAQLAAIEKRKEAEQEYYQLLSASRNNEIAEEAERLADAQKWINARDAIKQEEHEKEMARIEAEKNARLEAASSMYGTLKSIVQQYYSNEIAAAGDNEEKLQEIREKQFRANQAFGIADTIINTASSIMKVLAQGGIFAIPIAATMAALGAAQIGMIASAKPSFATGGSYVVPPGYEADNFPVNAASGETVTVTRPGQEGGQMLNAVINIDGYEFGRVITRLFEDRKATISGVRVA